MAQERAKQDKQHGYRLVNEMRKKNTVRNRIDAARHAALTESAESYRERVEGVWPIFVKG